MGVKIFYVLNHPVDHAACDHAYPVQFLNSSSLVVLKEQFIARAI
jgi:hypothetical protein